MRVTLIYFTRNAQPVASAAPVCRESLMKTCMISDHSWRCILNSFHSKYFLLMIVNVNESYKYFQSLFFRFNNFIPF